VLGGVLLPVLGGVLLEPKPALGVELVDPKLVPVVPLLKPP